MRVAEATPVSMMNRTALACHCTSQPCTMLLTPLGRWTSHRSLSEAATYAPAPTPSAGSTQYGSAMLRERTSPGNSARRHGTAPPRRALRANA